MNRDATGLFYTRSRSLNQRRVICTRSHPFSGYLLRTSLTAYTWKAIQFVSLFRFWEHFGKSIDRITILPFRIFLQKILKDRIGFRQKGVYSRPKVGVRN